ncbi:hypothetical protein WG66_011671 [Moniliophthora roreri]|nr:hypothetical protein WG66_011671 [Moniliophthora roreri]
MPSTRLAHIHHVSDDDNPHSSSTDSNYSGSGGLFQDFLSHIYGTMSMRGLFSFNSETDGEVGYREAAADMGSAACGRQRCLASKRRVDMYTNTPCSPAEGFSSRASACLTAEPKPEQFLSAAPKYPDYISSTTISRRRSRANSSLSQMDTGRLRVSGKRNRSKRQDESSSSMAASTTPNPASSGIDPSSFSTIASTSAPPSSSTAIASSSISSETSISSSFFTTFSESSSSVPLPTSISVSLSSTSTGTPTSVGLPSFSTQDSSSVPPVSSTTTQSENTTSISTSGSSPSTSSSPSSSSSSSTSFSSSSSSSTQPPSSTQPSPSTQPSSIQPPSSTQPSSTQPPSTTQTSSTQSPPSSSRPPSSSQLPSSSSQPPPSSSSLPPSASSPPPSSTTTSTLPASTVYSTITQFTTVSPGTTSFSSSTTTSTGVLNTNGPSDGSGFAQNKGAIIGVAVGGVIAVIIAVVLLFLFCRRWRRKRAESVLPAASTSPVVGLGSLRRDVSRGGLSGSSSRRMLIRNYSSTDPGHGGTWRPPLSDEDDDDPDPMQMAQIPPLPQSPMGVTGLSQGHSSSGEDLGSGSTGHGSSQGGHSYAPDQYAAYYNMPSNADLVRRSSTQNQMMPGFGQAAEHMVVATDLSSRTTTPMSPTFSIGPPPPPLPRSASFNKVPPPSAYAYPSSSHSHGSSSTDDVGLGPGRKNGSGTSLMHTNTMKSVTSSSSGSHSHSQSSVPVPRVRIQEATPTKADGDRLRGRRESTGSIKGLISRLRGGRSSTQELDSMSINGKGKAKEVFPTPASSSFYPPTSLSGPMRPSSLLNPPLPPPLPAGPVEMQQLGVEPAHVPLGWIHPEPAPFPSPAPTEESLHAPDGLLDPQLLSGSASVSRSDLHAPGHEITSRPSTGSLRDNIDYSRPYRGFVFNRMGSSTTFNTQDTRSTHAHTPGPSMLGVDDRIEEDEYFGIAR